MEKKILILGPTRTFPCNPGQTAEFLCLSCETGCRRPFHNFIMLGDSYGAPSKMPNQGSETQQITQCSGCRLQLLGGVATAALDTSGATYGNL